MGKSNMNQHVSVKRRQQQKGCLAEFLARRRSRDPKIFHHKPATTDGANNWLVGVSIRIYA